MENTTVMTSWNHQHVGVALTEVTGGPMLMPVGVSGGGAGGFAGLGLSFGEVLQLVKENPSLLLMFYSQLLAKKPIKTKAITAAVINVIGNVVNQTVFEKKLRGGGSLDIYRASTFGLYASVLSFIIHHWYLFLDSKSLTRNHVWVRLLVDQLFFSPFITAFFFAFMEVMAYIRETVTSTSERAPQPLADRIAKRLSQSYINTQQMCWRIWPLAQLINFRYVPAPYRVLFGNLVGFFWGIYLSYVNSQQQRVRRP
jgi:hypothetical protein